MSSPILTARRLNRALLARQLLLERVDRPIVDVVEQVGGLQTQYSPSGTWGCAVPTVWGSPRTGWAPLTPARRTASATSSATTGRASGRRRGAYRPRVFSDRNPFSVGTVLVDGAVAGSWTVRGGCVIVDPVRTLTATEADEIEVERVALEAFHR